MVGNTQVSLRMVNATVRELSRLLMVAKYVGEFKEGKFNGQGTFTSS